MSNELIQSIKQQIAVTGGMIDDDTRAVAGSGASNKRISIKGGVFRKIVGGKEVSKVTDRHMNVIFVKMAHNPSRTYYSKGYQEGTAIAPTCWSTDSKTPDAEVKNPQAKRCDACQWSVANSGASGTGTACRLQWRTAVVLPHDTGGDVMQLVLPSRSCFGKQEGNQFPFRAYIQMLAGNNISAGMVVTRVQFDTDSPVPRLQFSAVAAVPQEDVPTIQMQSQSQAAENAVKLTVFQQDGEEEVAEAESPVAEAPAEKEPTLVQTSKPAADGESIPDVLKKWSKKGK